MDGKSSNDGDEQSSVSGNNNTFDFADGQLSGGMPSAARLFVRNDIFAFKSKKDF